MDWARWSTPKWAQPRLWTRTRSSVKTVCAWSGKKFILCTGGHARRLDLPGEEFALSHKDVWSLSALPRSA